MQKQQAREFSDSRACLEQVTGIGPAPQAWEARILPLNYTCNIILIPYHNAPSAVKTADTNRLASRLPYAIGRHKAAYVHDKFFAIEN